MVLIYCNIIFECRCVIYLHLKQSILVDTIVITLFKLKYEPKVLQRNDNINKAITKQFLMNGH